MSTPPEKPIQQKIAELYEQLETMNYYQLLHVDRKATPAEIKRAYRKIVHEMHPDRHAAEIDDADRVLLEEIFNEINTAFSVLSNPEEKARYDQNLYMAESRGIKTRKGTEVQTAEEQYIRGKEALKKKELVRAIEFFRSAIQMNPNNPEYHAKLALALSSIPKYRKEAVEACRKAIKLNHENANYHALMGRIMQKSGDYQAALQHYRHALSWDPGNVVARREIPIVKGKLAELNPTFKQRLKQFFSRKKPEPKSGRPERGRPRGRSRSR
jgi:curved DNA-binding protein CbpA